MNTKQIFGVLLLIGGLAAVIYGLSIQGSMEYKFVSAFGGDTSRVVAMMVCGGIAAVVGLILILTGSGGGTSKSTPQQRPQATKTPAAGGLISGYDDEKLQEIVANSASYKPQVVEESRRELDLRIKSRALLPEVNAKTDEELREIIGNPQLYTDELIRSSQSVLDDRQRIWAERQEQEAKERRLERQRQAEQEQQRKEEAWQKKKPKLIKAGIVAVAVLVAAGVTGYLCSSGYRHSRGLSLFEKGELEKAIGSLSGVGKSSEHYADAQYHIYKAYLQQNDSLHAAKALEEAVSGNNWEHDSAYLTYTNYCMTGKFSPHIPKDELKAAAQYKHHPETDTRIKGGVIFFDHGSYDSAYEVFSELSNDWAKGYMGIMYLYGLGDLKRDIDTAADYLKSAPDCLPFLIYKGDVALLLNKKTERYMAIREANTYYKSALALDPKNVSLAKRAEVTGKLVEVADRHSDRDPWSSDNWDSYSFSGDSGGGSYSGEMANYGNYERGAHGWGCFTWHAGGMQFGRFSYCELNGPGIDVVVWNNDGEKLHDLYVGTYSNSVLVDGFRICHTGDVYAGKFNKDNSLAKGRRYDPHGRLKEVID